MMVTAAQIHDPSTARRPSLLWLIVALCGVRGIWGLWGFFVLMRYITQGAYAGSNLFFLYTGEAILWIILAIGLWRLSNLARLGTIILSVFAVAWSSYHFLSMMMHQAAHRYNTSLFAIFLVIDFANIAYLSQSSVKAQFGVSDAPAASLPAAS